MKYQKEVIEAMKKDPYQAGIKCTDIQEKQNLLDVLGKYVFNGYRDNFLGIFWHEDDELFNSGVYGSKILCTASEFLAMPYDKEDMTKDPTLMEGYIEKANLEDTNEWLAGKVKELTCQVKVLQEGVNSFARGEYGAQSRSVAEGILEEAFPKKETTMGEAIKQGLDFEFDGRPYHATVLDGVVRASNCEECAERAVSTKWILENLDKKVKVK